MMVRIPCTVKNGATHLISQTWLLEKLAVTLYDTVLGSTVFVTNQRRRVERIEGPSAMPFLEKVHGDVEWGGSMAKSTWPTCIKLWRVCATAAS